MAMVESVKSTEIKLFAFPKMMNLELRLLVPT